MGAPLSDYGPFDGRSAARAGFPLALVDLKIILEMPAFIGPVKAGTVIFDGKFEHFLNRIPQARTFRSAQVFARTGRQDPRVKQGFVGIDIPDTGNKTLIQKDGLDHPLLSCQP